MKVILTDAAEADLEAIGDWIERDNPERALTFTHELRHACETLADTPHGFALVPRYEHTGVRRRVLGLLSNSRRRDRGAPRSARRAGLWADLVSE
jgi:toxin ParE1/3/4